MATAFQVIAVDFHLQYLPSLVLILTILPMFLIFLTNPKPLTKEVSAFFPVDYFYFPNIFSLNSRSL